MEGGEGGYQDVEPNKTRFVPWIQQNLLAADALAASWTHLLLADDGPAPHAHLVERMAALQLDDVCEHVARRGAHSVHFGTAVVDELIAQRAASNSHKHAAIGAFHSLPVKHATQADVTGEV